jgi:hypothetical protein
MLTTDRVLNYGVLQRTGEVIELETNEALRLVRANQAELIETAMDEPRTEIRGRRHKHVAISVK